jgi:hypothetical protein
MPIDGANAYRSIDCIIARQIAEFGGLVFGLGGLGLVVRGSGLGSWLVVSG